MFITGYWIQLSVLYSRSLLLIYFVYIGCICYFQTLNLSPLHCFSHLVTISLFSMSVSLWNMSFIKQVHQQGDIATLTDYFTSTHAETDIHASLTEGAWSMWMSWNQMQNFICIGYSLGGLSYHHFIKEATS